MEYEYIKHIEGITMKRFSRKLLCLFSIFMILLLSSSMTFGETVNASGQAIILNGNTVKAKAQAIQLAQRAAVERGVGTLIDSQTRVENFTLLSDRIYSRASGYVTKYEVISEEVSHDGSIYNVEIRADVQTTSIENDLRAIGILMEQVGNPRFMVIYLPETGCSAYRNSRVVSAAEHAINGVFARKGFIVLDRMFIDNFYNQIEQGGLIDVGTSDLSHLARMYQADLLLLYNVHAAERAGGESRYFGGVLVELSLRAVASATADLIAQKSGDIYVKTIKNAGQYYNDMQASNAADKLGKAVAEALIEDTLAYFERSVHAGTRFDLHFRNFSGNEVYAIVDVIEDLPGYKNKQVRNQSTGYLQLEVNYQGKKFDFQDDLLGELTRKEIHYTLHQVTGNRFLFFKDGTINPY